MPNIIEGVAQALGVAFTITLISAPSFLAASIAIGRAAHDGTRLAETGDRIGELVAPATATAIILAILAIALHNIALTLGYAI